MSPSNPPTAPRLEPPGAGVPVIERLVGGLVVSLRRRFGSAASIAARFEAERRAISLLCQGQDDEALGDRVLIPRLRGLEDSSRYWSVWMTLDHLRIVNEAITGAVRELMAGGVPPGVASTAAVKPREGVGAEVAVAYESSCAGLVSLFMGGRSLRTTCRYAHPWFGPLDGSGWCVLSAMHMGIHRRQIERILEERLRGGD